MESLAGLSDVVWAKGTHAFSLLTSLAVLGFIYALMGRARGLGFKIWTLYIGGLTTYTVLSPQAYADPKFIELMGVLGPLACYFYSIGLMIHTYRRSTDRPLRMRILCTTVGLGGAVFIYTLFGNILPEALGWDGETIKAYILIFNGAWISSFVMVAAVRYGIVSMQLDEIAEDLFTHVADPVILISPNGQISRVNPAAVSRFPSVFTGDPLPPISSFIESKHLASETFETKTLSASEDRVFVCNLSDVRRGEELLGNILHMRDVTREKEVDRMKTEFTSTVSHELRTPLTSILGFTKLIQKRFEGVIRPKFEAETKKEERAAKKIEENLEVILSEGARLTNLINDVLDLSKMEAGRIDWSIQTHEMEKIIYQAVAASAGLFSAKPSVSLEQDHRDPLPTLEVDGDRLIQVLLNLLSNAVKFTDSGIIVLRTETVESEFQVSVVDRGIGIADGDRSKVFEKYRQVGDHVTDRPKGTGLGLPISKEIVEHHGGRIWVDSVLGQGSTFSFTIPLPEGEA